MMYLVNSLFTFAFAWVYYDHRKSKGDEMGKFGSWDYWIGCVIFILAINILEHFLRF